MPRSIQEILDHADELARRFEEYEPDPGDEKPVAEYLLRRAVLERALSERRIVEAVVAAREEGLSWARIGELLGTSAQAAQQRYGAITGGVSSGEGFDETSSLVSSRWSFEKGSYARGSVIVDALPVGDGADAPGGV